MISLGSCALVFSKVSVYHISAAVLFHAYRLLHVSMDCFNKMLFPCTGTFVLAMATSCERHNAIRFSALHRNASKGIITKEWPASASNH